MVHPSLHVRNIDLLPPGRRVRAHAATRFSEPRETIREVCDIVEKIPKEQAILLLPVLYANLDASRIPAPHQLDRLIGTSDLDELLLRPMLSLRTLEKIPGIPPGAFADLWPPVWNWIQFMFTYQEFFDGISEREIGVQLLSLISLFSSDKAMAKLIRFTPRVRIVVARTWSLLVVADGIPIPNVWVQNLCNFLTCDTSYPLHVEELLEGVGGTFKDLGSVVVRHIHGFMPPRQPPSSLSFFFFTTVIMFLVKLRGVAPEDELWPALLNEGLARILPLAMHTLLEAKLANFEDMAHTIHGQCFLIMKSLLDAASDPWWTVAALQAQFLRVLVLSASPPDPWKPLDVKHFFLRVKLPTALVYRSVILQMERAVKDVGDLAATSAFRTSSIFDDWVKLVELVNERVALVRSWDADGYESRRACDDPECCEIRKETEFRRCSGCLGRYYCSTQCQRQDWKREHHEECHQMRTSYLTDPDPLGKRDRIFLRKLLHHDYDSMKQEVYMRELAFLHENPGHGLLLHALFDYSKTGRAILSVNGMLGIFPRNLPTDLSAASRVLASDGKMELHIMITAEGAKSRRRALPLYSASPDVSNGMRVISEDIAHEDAFTDVHDSLTRRVQGLLELSGATTH
ncbi:hypothetical protein C8R43DRAFT_39634 [Mycena crocata]|nr:hypothetical protein C8R43DRAFT_39634 [Mycena crocata]